ncbi:MAG: hypothetical protein AB1486_18985 [Planctomycetota bacterium]
MMNKRTPTLRGFLAPLLALGLVAPQSSGTPGDASELEPLPTAASAARPDVAKLMRDAVQWLVSNQNPNGSWGSHHSPRPIEVMASVPGGHEAFRVATTALCVIALEDSPYRPTEAQAAAARGLDYLLDNYNVKRPNGFEFYNTWAIGYTLQCFGEWLGRKPDDPRAERIRAAVEHLIRKADIYQTPQGGWGYLDFEAQTFKPSWAYMSFTTATMLVGLARVRDQGIEIPAHILDKGMRAIERSRTPEGNYLYGDYLRYRPRMGINQDKGSACRTPLCQYTMQLYGHEVSLAERRRALDDLLVNTTDFQRIASRRPIPHESWYQISGYFYLYGHAYAAYVLEQMPEEDQQRLWPAMVDALTHCHQPDGSFWDYPLYSYHKPYGTAFALMTLARVPQSTVEKGPS